MYNRTCRLPLFTESSWRVPQARNVHASWDMFDAGGCWMPPGATPSWTLTQHGTRAQENGNDAAPEQRRHLATSTLPTSLKHDTTSFLITQRVCNGRCLLSVACLPTTPNRAQSPSTPSRQQGANLDDGMRPELDCDICPNSVGKRCSSKPRPSEHSSLLP